MSKSPPSPVWILCPKDWPEISLIEGWFAKSVATLGLHRKVQVVPYLLNRQQDLGSVPPGSCGSVLCQAMDRETVATELASLVPPLEIWDLEPQLDRARSIQAEINEWVARQITGLPRLKPATPMPTPSKTTDSSKEANPKPEPGKKGPIISLGRETKGRGGKGVTLLFDLPFSLTQAQELFVTLKNKCGTGGTVKDGRIEIQGDQRERIAQVLENMGYRVKRVGG